VKNKNKNKISAWLLVLFTIAATFSGSVSPSTPVLAAAEPAELPRVYINSTYTAPIGGKTWDVKAGDNLQTVFNSANLGDVISIQAGATFTGNFTIPAKTGNGWLVIKSSMSDSLPAQGTRVNPNHANLMPKLISVNATNVLSIPSGAKNIRFIGIEFTENSSYVPGVGSPNLSNGLISVGGGHTTVDQQPVNIFFDRVYVHGSPTHWVKRGIALNAVNGVVVDSHISDIKGLGQDTQAVYVANTFGPTKLVNNFFEAAGENVMFGGSDPTLPNAVPSDIEIRGNYFYKPLAWKSLPSPSDPWLVKNIFELKSARRVLISGNVFENSWVHGQIGYGLLFKSTNQNGGCTWCVTEHVTVENNLIKNVNVGVSLCGICGEAAQAANHFSFKNNIFDQVAEGAIITVGNVSNISFDHNIFINGGNLLSVANKTDILQNFEFKNNIVNRGPYGIKSSGGAEGISTITATMPNAAFQNNVIVGAEAAIYPTSNFFPTNIQTVGFTNLAGGDFTLTTSSPYRSISTDGKDLGVDNPVVVTAASLAISGGAGGAWTPPTQTLPAPDTTAPTISVSSPVSGSTQTGTVNITASASDNTGVVGVQFKVDGNNLGSEDLTTPYTASWNTTTFTNGSHTITAVARDSAGNTTTSSSVVVTTSNTVVVPVPDLPVSSEIRASIVFPGGTLGLRGTVSGTVSVTSKTPVTSVQAWVDGKGLDISSTSPYAFSINTTLYEDGDHKMAVIVKNASGVEARDELTLKMSNKTDLISANVILPAGATLGDLIKFQGGSSVYLVTKDGLSLFDSYKSLQLYQASNPSEVVREVTGNAFSYTLDPRLAREVLGQSEVQLTSKTLPFPSGALVNDHGTIYFISADKKVPFTSASAFLGLGYKFENVVTGDLADYALPLKGYTISTADQDHPFGSWVLINKTVYYSTEAGMIGVPSVEILQGNGGSLARIVPGNKYDLYRLQNLPAQAPLVFDDVRVRY
jgi:hypothetical protein